MLIPVYSQMYRSYAGRSDSMILAQSNRRRLWHIKSWGAIVLYKNVIIAKMKSRTVAIILALFLGSIGGHKLYLWRPFQFILYFLFCWTGVPFIFSLMEALKYLLIGKDMFDAKYNAEAMRNLDYILTRKSWQ